MEIFSFTYEQLATLGLVVAAAYFSYKSGWRDGTMSGIHHCLKGLTEMGYIVQYEDPETGELEIGRYDVEMKPVSLADEKK
jgi:hypothetical protein